MELKRYRIDRARMRVQHAQQRLIAITADVRAARLEYELDVEAATISLAAARAELAAARRP